MPSQTRQQVTEQAVRWREANPDMWDAFVSEARNAADNHEQWSARGIAERIRWSPSFKRAYGFQFKVPNAITPVLGRMVVEEYPRTGEFFRCAHSKVDA